tara:strand:+ start:706 stop:828 length:123 start_codon:yes stop_codon:yes gene_type:complete
MKYSVKALAVTLPNGTFRIMDDLKHLLMIENLISQKVMYV